MRAARLLPDREDDAGRDRPCQQPSGQARPPVAKREVEGHQREPGRRVSAGIAVTPGVAVGRVGEQRRIGAVPAETGDIARAVHARHLLEAADGRGHEDEPEDDIPRAGAQAPETR